MNQPINLMFDEMFGWPLVSALQELLRVATHNPGIQFDSVPRRFHSGALDPDWVPKLEPETWIVVSADRAKRKHGGDKLLRVCSDNNVTLVLIRGKLTNAPQMNKVQALLATWDTILDDVANSPHGSRFHLRHSSGGTPTLTLLAPPGT